LEGLKREWGGKGGPIIFKTTVRKRGSPPRWTARTNSRGVSSSRGGERLGGLHFLSMCTAKKKKFQRKRLDKECVGRLAAPFEKRNGKKVRGGISGQKPPPPGPVPC